MNHKYIITVQDSLSGGKVTVEIEEKEIYDACRRSFWNIEKNNQKHSKMETPFSSLIGGDDGAYENFAEFVSIVESPLDIFTRKDMLNNLYAGIESLNENERVLVKELFYNSKTERALANQLGVNRNVIHQRKCRVMAKLKIFLEKYHEYHKY